MLAQAGLSFPRTATGNPSLRCETGAHTAPTICNKVAFMRYSQLSCIYLEKSVISFADGIACSSTLTLISHSP